MTIECVDDISAVRLKLPTELTSREARDQVARMVKVRRGVLGAPG